MVAGELDQSAEKGSESRCNRKMESQNFPVDGTGCEG